MQLIRGQKLKVNDILPNASSFSLQVDITSSLVIDVSIFGLDNANRLSDEAYMIFYNQPISPCNSIKLTKNSDKHSVFEVNLSALDTKIEHLMVTLAIDGPGMMSQIGNSQISILNLQGQVVASFAFDGNMFEQQRAIMLLECYKKDGIWRFNAVGQGFNGGLPSLIEYYGGEVAESSQAPALDASKAQTQNVATPTKVSLTKVTLDKPNIPHRVNLTKQQSSFIVEAIWVDNGDSCSDNDDLDLRVGILIEGEKKMHYIHAPKQMGALEKFPFIRHLGDVTGASTSEPGVERVEINSDIAKLIGGRVGIVFSVYSAISNGAVSIASLQPKMRMQYGDQIVECVFNPSVSAKAKSSYVYTYVIGTAVIDQQGIVIEHSGQTSKLHSEDTPRLHWQQGKLSTTIDGEPMFK